MIYKIFLVFGLLCFPLVSLAGNTKSLIIPQKIVQITNPYISVVAVPVVTSGLSYHFEVQDDEVIDGRIENALKRRELEIKPESDTEKVIETEENTSLPVEDNTFPVNENDDKDLHSQVESLITNNCKNCHDGNDPERWTLIKDGKLNDDLTLLQWWKIFDKVDGQGLPLSKVMPKNGKPFEDSQVRVIRDYIRTLPPNK